MEVKNATYFHIHRVGPHSSLWQVGARINWVQKRNNLFYDYYNRTQLSHDDGSGALPFRKALERYLANDDAAYKEEQGERLIQASLGIVKDLCMFVREVIFEEVRSNYFPQLPSRKTCIWVFPASATEFWWKTLKPEERRLRILKLRLTGTMHIADQRHLYADTFRHDDLRAKAFEYWTGTDGKAEEEQEMLFEGIIDVLAQYESIEAFKEAEQDVPVD